MQPCNYQHLYYGYCQHNRSVFYSGTGIYGQFSTGIFFCAWLDKEINLSAFRYSRHASRFKFLMQKLWQAMVNTLPFACQDRASVKSG
ncbi:transposase DNA-binding-containing protein [Acerihabitans arboris]|uniref:Transposase Tn5-like N-terminal domain-containing protein n=1 Tax=Acerihabitans arboris TaxID=2691583 RepID=A0A845SE03_9GAMM|nr:transposase DNA-binding-containing protein [Acerihabitans arboris]NDL61607.1 hypothetical protein [Acerihabitans arboris]